MLGNRVIGPYLFDNDTINEQNSHSMLKEFFVPELTRLDKESSGIFREDGAPAHFSREMFVSISTKSVDKKEWSH